jgi:hypothetical protein
MASSEMLRRVALVRTDVLEERSASFFRVTRIGELGAALAITGNRHTLRSSSETSVLTRATRRNIPEDIILHSHRRENLKSDECREVGRINGRRNRSTVRRRVVVPLCPQAIPYDITYILTLTAV